MNTKKIAPFIIILIILAAGLYWFNDMRDDEPSTGSNAVQITPVSHASLILDWADTSLYVDPVGTSTYYTTGRIADVILLTDIHGDHLSTSTLSRLVGGSTTIIVPQAVYDLLPATLQSKSVVMKNGDKKEVNSFEITAVPMYNMPESSDSRHIKGRGNGYVIERDGERVYIAGDTGGTPEMKKLRNIDIAFIPMNLPYTMGVQEAAEAVLAFKPKKVYPYHYRGEKGFTDIEEFREAVVTESKDIEVILLNWYPTR